MACLWAASGRAGDEAPLPAVGETVERELAAGEAHAFRFEPSGRRPARLVVEQVGIDVEIGVETAEGLAFVADGPFDRRGREAVLLAGSTSYRIAVRGREVGAPPGRYRLHLEPIDAEPPDGDRRLAAARAETAAARLYRQGIPDAWREAAVHCRRALELWRALGEEAEAARVLYAQAVLHRLADAPREALEAAGEARELARRLGEELLAGYADNELGLGHLQAGDLDAAGQAFERSAAAGDAGGDGFLAAAAANNLCLMDLSRGQIEAARACYQRSMPAIERPRAAQIESAARTNLGRLAEHLGEPEEALGHYRRALELLEAAGERRSQARTLNNLGVLLRGLGDLDAAMARYAEASEIFEAIGERRWQARVLCNVGFVYRSVDEPRRALVSFSRARDFFRLAQDRRGEATALDNLGLVQRQLGRPEEALGLHRQALELRRRAGHRRGEAVTLRRLGEVHAELRDVEAARRRLGEAAGLADELGDRLHGAKARRGLAEIDLRRGELDAARRQLETALGLISGGGRRASEAELLVDLARTERAAGQPEVARRHVAAALERLEDLRARIDSPDLRTSYSSLLRGAYELDVDLLMAAHRADPAAGFDRRALEVTERARARALLELLQEAEVDLTAGVDPALLERRRSLARRLDAKTERLVDRKLDAASREALEAEQLVLLQRLEVADAEIRRQSPAYGEIVRPRPLAAKEIQALVDPGTALAVYLLAEPRSYLWRVTAAAIDAFELPGRGRIETAARRLHALWSELDVPARAHDHAAAQELAWMLRLSELAGPRRLAVLADGALHVVPFAALPVLASDSAGAPAPATTASGAPDTLLALADVVILPSASVLAFDRRRPARAPRRGSVAVLADPVFGPDYPRLAGSRREAEIIAGAIAPAKGLQALGFEADRELVTGGRLEGFDVLHFATHGVIDTENPALSGLVLSQVDAAGRPKPGFLALHDVYNLRLDAELVVLSGCRTALGPVVRGEGLIGLARGFMYAGARRVVASLWPVEEWATAALMTAFYRALWHDALPPAAALARAQREVAKIRSFRDPYHWAGFVLVGDWR